MLPVNWTSKISLRYKRNATTGELHRTKNIATNLETQQIFPKNISGGYPEKLSNNIQNRFQEKCGPRRLIEDWQKSLSIHLFQNIRKSLWNIFQKAKQFSKC